MVELLLKGPCIGWWCGVEVKIVELAVLFNTESGGSLRKGVF